MKTINSIVCLQKATVVVWGTSKDSKLGAVKTTNLANTALRGEVTFYGTSVKVNPFTKEYTPLEDGSYALDMRAIKFSVPLRLVQPFILNRVADATNECVKIGNHSNAQVFHMTLCDAKISATADSCWEITEIIEEFNEDYFSVRSVDGRIEMERDSKGRLFRTSVLHAYACDALGFSVEQAIANWHSNHKTTTGLAATNVTIADRRNNALEYLKQLKASLKKDGEKVDE